MTPQTQQTTARPGRNEPCHCGSGRKYKHCCLEKDEAKAVSARKKAAAKTTAEPGDTAEATAAKPARAPKHKTEQPWKATTARGFVPRSRTPRKVGGG